MDLLGLAGGAGYSLLLGVVLCILGLVAWRQRKPDYPFSPQSLRQYNFRWESRAIFAWFAGGMLLLAGTLAYIVAFMQSAV